MRNVLKKQRLSSEELKSRESTNRNFRNSYVAIKINVMDLNSDLERSDTLQSERTTELNSFTVKTYATILYVLGQYVHYKCKRVEIGLYIHTTNH